MHHVAHVHDLVGLERDRGNACVHLVRAHTRRDEKAVIALEQARHRGAVACHDLSVVRERREWLLREVQRAFGALLEGVARKVRELPDAYDLARGERVSLPHEDVRLGLEERREDEA